MNICFICMCVHVSACMWRSGDNSQKAGLSFHYGGYMAQTQVIRQDKPLGAEPAHQPELLYF